MIGRDRHGQRATNGGGAPSIHLPHTGLAQAALIIKEERYYEGNRKKYSGY